ncbi:hypothetical protein [Methanocella arvoryzae]|nr:hypothetical protein [Methanocella arvoryzae]
MPKNSKVPLHRTTTQGLTVENKVMRAKTTEVVGIARRTGKPIQDLARQYGLTMDEIKRHTGAVKKLGDTWAVTAYDHVPREMLIFENGREVQIEVADSREATKISQYHNAIRGYLAAKGPAKEKALRQLKNYGSIRIKDATGRLHSLETDPDVIREIVLRKEVPEYPEPYPEGWR